ncbi:MAG: efflux RND transporter periplasmic adaptor subunit, partial [Limisphaerales bacterium]
RGIFQNKDRALVPGAFARIRLPVEKIDSAILIPEAAILAEQTRKYVYVLSKEGVVEPRPVVVGSPQEKMQRIVLSGISPEDNIVVSGLLMLRPGMKVQVIDPNKPMPMPGMQPQPGQGPSGGAPQQKPQAPGANPKQ